MRLLIDMNLSPRWVEALEAAGFDSIHWSLVGAGDASDAQIMAYAKENDFVVLTHDLDFGAILASTRGDRPSVVQIRADDVSPEAICRHVAAALRQMRRELTVGALITIDPARTRVRVLPLRSE